MGIDSIELGRFDQSLGDGDGLTACLGAHEEVDEMTVSADA